jgi:hypothetical protein
MVSKGIATNHELCLTYLTEFVFFIEKGTNPNSMATMASIGAT